MYSLFMGLASAVCVFGGTIVGMMLSRTLPGHHLSTESKDTIKLVSGIVATLTALVLSLLIASAKSSFDSVSNEIVDAGSKIIALNHVLISYGPESKPVREILRESINRGVQKIWGDKSMNAGVEVLETGTGIQRMQDQLNLLTPTTDAQRELLSEARGLVSSLSQSRWMLVEQEQGELPTALFVIMLSWLSMLFISIGMFAPHNGTVLAAVFFCALSLSTAIFVIEEMNRPLNGFIRVSSAPMVKALKYLNQ